MFSTGFTSLSVLLLFLYRSPSSALCTVFGIDVYIPHRKYQVKPHSSPWFCIPVVVLKNCEPELSYILAELFNKCLKESCFPDCWKVSSAVPVFKNVGERSTAKNYRPVSLLSAVSKVFEKLVNNKIVDHLEKCGFFF